MERKTKLRTLTLIIITIISQTTNAILLKPIDTINTTNDNLQNFEIDNFKTQITKEPVVIEPETQLTKEPVVIEPEIQITKEPVVIETETQITKEPVVIETETQITKEPVVIEPETQITKEPAVIEPETQITKDPVFIEPETQITKEPAVIETETQITKEPAVIDPETQITKEPVVIKTYIVKEKKQMPKLNLLIDKNWSQKDILFFKDQFTGILSLCGYDDKDYKYQKNTVIVSPNNDELSLICKELISKEIKPTCNAGIISNFTINGEQEDQNLILYSNKMDFLNGTNILNGMIYCNIKDENNKIKYRLTKKINYKIKENNPNIFPYNYTISNGKMVHGYSSVVTLIPNTNLIEKKTKNIVIL